MPSWVRLAAPPAQCGAMTSPGDRVRGTGQVDLGEGPEWARLSAEAFAVAHPIGTRPPPGVLNRVLVRALLPVLKDVPSEELLKAKPLVLSLALPLPPRLRFYVFQATQHESERQADTYRIQLTAGEPLRERRYCFSRADNIRPVLLGYDPRLDAFIIWDADVNDAGSGFPYSKGVQAPPAVVYGAVANGLAEGERHVRQAGRPETIIAARGDRLVDGLLRRITTSNVALTSEPAC